MPDGKNVTIIGAGPAGLACAIALKKCGVSTTVFDKGTVADAIRRFPWHMTFFSTADLLEIGDVPFLSAGFRPTRIEVLRYYQKVAHFFDLTIQSHCAVRSIRRTAEGFSVETESGVFPATHVVVATGYYDSPNPFVVPGAELPKVHRTYTEPYSYAGKKIAIVGGRNSAIEMALELYRHGIDVTLIHRRPQLSDGVKYWLLPDVMNRISAGEIKGFFETEVAEVKRHSLVLKGKHAGEVPNDDLFVMIGYAPQNDLLEAAGIETDPESAIPRHDPETFETNVQNLYIAGSIAAGRYNNKIFIENGRLHGEVIAGNIARK